MFSMDVSTQHAIKKYPHRAADIANSYDPRKIRNKQWMLRRLKKFQKDGMIPDPIPRIYIVGGWYGNILIPLIDEYLNYEAAHVIELDKEAIYIGREYFFKDHKKIKWIHGDATKMQFSGNSVLVINTSAEHMVPLDIVSGIVAVQSNDYYDVDEHLNCVSSAEELRDQYGFTKVWDIGKKDMKIYNRFMVIGRIQNED